MATFAQLMDRIKDEMDLHDSNSNPAQTLFVSDKDLRVYLNAAVRDAEKEIHNLFEDYFLSITDLTMTLDSKIVTFPSNIYANKIRKLFYFPTDKNNRYEIKRIIDKTLLMDIEDNDDYMYQIVNDSTNGNHIELNPASRETSTLLKCLYIRNAKTIATDGTEDSEMLDIPECEDFIIAHVKAAVYENDGDPRMQKAEQKTEKERGQMIKSLNRSVPDEDTLIKQDLSFYDDFSGYNDIIIG